MSDIGRLVLSKARFVKVHDKRFLNEEAMAAAIPDAIPIEVDLGFQGLQNEYVNIRIGHKKPWVCELTPEQLKFAAKNIDSAVILRSLSAIRSLEMSSNTQGWVTGKRNRKTRTEPWQLNDHEGDSKENLEYPSSVTFRVEWIKESKDKTIQAK